MPKEEYDFVEHWAKYYKTNPDDARTQNAKFINSIFAKHYDWRTMILSKPNGVEILSKLYDVKNPEILDMWKKKAKTVQIKL